MKSMTMTLFLCSMIFSQTGAFKKAQLKYERVRAAEKKYAASINALLLTKGIGEHGFDLYLRAFKDEGELEVWAKESESKSFVLLRNYAVCGKSGILGPKRKQGDYQVPEGFYHVDRFNPVSNYHLSLGINYPNRSDKILSDQKRPGGDIFIHGGCATIGCLPINNEQIKELYLLCVESKDRGSDNIPVSIFPKRMTEVNLKSLMAEFPTDKDSHSLWTELKSAYEHFNRNHTLPSIRFTADGSHEVLE